jgi:MFS transporter, ACS family, glucarate transporter
MKKNHIPKRYFFMLTAFFITLLLYIDRVCISSAEGAISSSLGLDKTQMGWVMASFALGYALFQIPGGWFADRYGPRRTMAVIVSIWSAFTALTGAAWNYVSILVFRFIFGAGEAGAFPTNSRAAINWIPLKERGIFQGINFSGSRVGAAFALPLVAYMIEALGWRPTFFILGAVGVMAAIAWFLLFRDDPVDHPAITEVEKAYIKENRQKIDPGAKKQNIAMAKIFRSKNVWLLMGQYVASNFIFFFCLTWLFPYLKEKYNLEMVEAGFYSMFPLIAGAVGNWTSGAFVDFIYRRGNWPWSRKLPAITGFVLVIAGLVATLYMEDVTGAIVCLSIAIFGADMSISPSWSTCMDVGKEHSGKVSGTMNMAGNLGSFVTALAFPYLLEWTGDEKAFFYIASVFSFLAILCWLNIKPNKPINNE